MSWFFCHWEKPEKNRLNYNEIHSNDENISIVENSELYLASGGLNNFFSYDDITKKGWLLCGTGIKYRNNEHLFMDKNDWDKLLNEANPKFEDINGHYVALRYDYNKIELFTDFLGLRDIYYYYNGKSFIASSRLDWVAKCINTEIDFEVFSTRWLLFNQLTDKCFLKNVNRLVLGKSALIDAHGIRISIPDPLDHFVNYSNQVDFDQHLSSIINAGFKTCKKLSLSLPGGLDSRVILSLLLKQKNNNWDCHTFGNPDSPDSKIAKKISVKLHIPHNQYYSTTLDWQVVSKLMTDFAARNLVANPITTAFQTRYYEEIKSNKYIIIDGGFGEIWRGEFAKRLSVFGKKSLQERNLQSIIKLITYFKADIFNQDVIEIINKASLLQISEILDVLPEINKLGKETWIDLFLIKTRLTNYYGQEQSRIDDIVTSYMPYAQKSLLSMLFRGNHDVVIKKRNFKDIIKKHSSSLKRFPLAKSDVIYPFWLNSLSARAYAKVKKKYFENFLDMDWIKFFYRNSNTILDMLNSSDIQKYSAYDKQKLIRLSNNLKKDNLNVLNQIDWWLSFELFRQKL